MVVLALDNGPPWSLATLALGSGACILVLAAVDDLSARAPTASWLLRTLVALGRQLRRAIHRLRRPEAGALVEVRLGSARA
eukprot:1222608-Prymnesium_polylepis.1